MRDAADADAALADAPAGAAVELWSARGGGMGVGAGWLWATVERAAAARPDVTVTGILDCAAWPGPALAALRLGLGICFGGHAGAGARLAAIAAAAGRPFYAARPAELEDADP